MNHYEGFLWGRVILPCSGCGNTARAKETHVFTCPVEPYVGQPYKTAAHVMKRLCAKAKVKPFGFHAIRHLAATILAQEGKNLFAIQHALRHEKQTTTDRYLHSLEAFAEVSDALSALASRGPASCHPFPAPAALLRKKDSFTRPGQQIGKGPASARYANDTVSPEIHATLRSAGLYGSQDGILAALGLSLIGSAAENLLEKVMPHEIAAREASCNQGIVMPYSNRATTLTR